MSEVIGFITTDDEICTLGKHGVEKIEYHTPMGDGDAHYCDYYTKGFKKRCFSLKEVIWNTRVGDNS